MSNAAPASIDFLETWGGRGGWGGWGYGVGLGWNPWWWGPYGYDYYPYYDYGDPYDYGAPDAYGYAPQQAPAVQAPPQDYSRHDLTVVSDYHSELRALLDQKLKDGSITKVQRDAEAAHLDQMDKQAHEEADTNGHYLTGDQENVLIQQYQRAYYFINHNFVAG